MCHDSLQSLLAVGTAAGSIHVWGAPGVYLTWKNRPAHEIKHISFKPGSSLIFCIVSPAHSHLFLGLKDGTVDCFDLDRGVTSPYRIRNLWLEHDEMLRRSGVPDAPSRRHIPVCTDLKCHPLDLNLLLIAHEGGITLYDLKQQSAIRSYELVIPPGAIGSTRNSNSPLIFEERRPSVTCLAFRPDGEMFVSGHLDGCLAFWSLHDGDVPILVRTMEREDALVFDWGETESKVDQKPSNSRLTPEEPTREPIFRIAWSSFPSESNSSGLSKNPIFSVDNLDTSDQPRSSKDGTLLTVLGGLMSGDPVGVHVFHLPAYHSANITKEMTPELRESLRASTSPSGHSIYLTSETPEDFLLIPRSNPYFDGSHDPISIIINCTAQIDVPPRFSTGIPSTDHSGVDSKPSVSDRSLRAFTFPPSLKHEPRELQLPGTFDWIGSNTVIACEVFELPETAYHKLLEPTPDSSLGRNDVARLPLNGGKAGISPAFRSDHATSSELITEFQQKFRIMVTVHMNKKIRFWDFSMGLLLPINPSNRSSTDAIYSTPGKLKTEFPARLDHLTIDLNIFLDQTSNLYPRQHLDQPVRVFLSTESLDLVLTFPDHQILVYSFHQAKYISPQKTNIASDPTQFTLSTGDPTSAILVDGHELDSKTTTSDEPQGAVEAAEPQVSSEAAQLKTVMEDSEKDISKLKVSLPPIDTDVTTDPKPQEATPSTPVGKTAPPPPRPPRSGRRVVSTSCTRSNTPEITANVSNTAQMEEKVLQNSIGLDLSDIQSYYETQACFRPMIWLKNESTTNELVVAISDMGFMAIAQADQTTLKVYDLRNQKLLLDDQVIPQNHNAGKGKQKSEEKRIRCLRWAVSALYTAVTVYADLTDSLMLPRLLVGYEDGTFDFLKLYLSQSHMIDSWSATGLSNDSIGHEKNEKGENNPPIGCFVFDSQGQIQSSNLASLQRALSEGTRMDPITDQHHDGSSSKAIHGLLVIVSRRSVVVRLNINGPLLLKKENLSNEPVIQATIIRYHTSCALLLIDEKRMCYVLSLPHLDQICKTFLPVINGVGRLTIDSSADVIEQVDLATIHLTTLFVGRDSAYLPSVTAHNPNIKTPEPPHPRTSALAAASTLASNLVSWLQGANVAQHSSNNHYPNDLNHSSSIRITGAEIDSILAGPLRPEKPISSLQPPTQSRISHVMIPTHQTKSITNSNANTNDQLSQNLNELNQRGDRLETLNERFDDLSNAASQLVQQAKRIGQQQASKSAFSSGISGVKSFFK
ncbi:uncharacterized protein MELLADRAFT_91096 [Melampsora larici-populina 98AG31]|uniref:V-SNARE coiled-coil homology domain-containing protein n=1 Tax=Melampsora larici-populina (strain 98AG31 / pathotype 3-4-7) TaxID=747676 RepID=F4R751_MELLP|nr:uncharacterized protein MELLADRAFT_91096 [Melampsora larici-populina 98AG31]EGG11524.1 hypothetical protein MELLADRAFT_91096 [Melampsora larici-populina 98AG31]